MPCLSLIAALASNRIIGHRNTLPWHLPEDLRHFKRLTLGHPILMGRKTWESIGRPLPGRQNIVVTRDTSFSAPGAQIAHSVTQALALAENTEEVFVIGGAQLYVETLPLARKMYLTEIHRDFAGDAYFPLFSTDAWQEVQRTAGSASADFAFDFVMYEHRAEISLTSKPSPS